MIDLAPRREDLEPIEIAPAEQLARLQLQRLQWTLRHAYDNVPEYQRRFDAAGVHPGDCRSLDDLARFPFTTKEHLRRNYPFGMFAVPRAQVVRVHASSGTTGRPTVVGYTRNDLDMWAAVVARSIRAAGGRPGDIVHVAYGYGLFTGGLGAHYGAERLGCTVVPVSGGMTERQVQLIADFKPQVIMVTPSYMLAIVDEMERQGIDPRSTSLQVGIFGAEPWTERMRGEIEELILRVPGLSPHFQLVLTRPLRLDELTVRVEARPDTAPAEGRPSMAASLAAAVKERIGVSVAVDVVEPGAIERSQGKARRIVDLRPGNA